MIRLKTDGSLRSAEEEAPSYREARSLVDGLQPWDAKRKEVRGFEEERKRKYCGDHKEKGMINLHNGGKKRCEIHGCETIATFGVVGKGRKPLYCRDHREPEMVDVMKRTCEVDGCTTIPCFGEREGGKPRFCSLHNVHEFSNVRNKQCSVTGCKKPRVEHVNGTTSYCTKHVNVQNRPKAQPRPRTKSTAAGTGESLGSSAVSTVGVKRTHEAKRRTRKRSKTASPEAAPTAAGTGEESQGSSAVSTVGVKRTHEGHPRDPEASSSGESLMASQGAQEAGGQGASLVNDVHDGDDYSAERAGDGVMAVDGSNLEAMPFVQIAADDAGQQEMMMQLFVNEEPLDFPEAFNDPLVAGTGDHNPLSTPSVGAVPQPNSTSGSVHVDVGDLQMMEKVFAAQNAAYGVPEYDDVHDVLYDGVLSVAV